MSKGKIQITEKSQRCQNITAGNYLYRSRWKCLALRFLSTFSSFCFSTKARCLTVVINWSKRCIFLSIMVKTGKEERECIITARLQTSMHQSQGWGLVLLQKKLSNWRSLLTGLSTCNPFSSPEYRGGLDWKAESTTRKQTSKKDIQLGVSIGTRHMGVVCRGIEFNFLTADEVWRTGSVTNSKLLKFTKISQLIGRPEKKEWSLALA